MKDLMNFNISVIDISKDSDDFFMKYNVLNPGDELVIKDNSDPKFFYYELLSEKGHTFSWDYVEKGPETWIIKIIKRKDRESPTLGQIAATDYRKAQVFRKYGLDFSFCGKKTLQEACAEKNISADTIQKKLYSACIQPLINSLNYNNWELDFMTDYIVSNHHQYIKELIAGIQELNKKVVKIHSSQYPQLNGITQAFQQLALEMGENMVKEEQILFPSIRFLVQVKKGKVSASYLPRSVQQFISMLEAEHDSIGQHMKNIFLLTDKYTLPPNATSSLILLYKWLYAFENDVQQHVHLENNILFPKAIELEQQYHEESVVFKRDAMKLPEFTNARRDLL